MNEGRRRGRPPSAAGLVHGRDGSDLAKLRLRLFLETIAAEKSLAEASAELGVKERAFLKLRTRWLQESIEGLEPRRVGRPPSRDHERDGEIDGLRDELALAQRELLATQVREEIAVVFPALLERQKKVESARARTRKQKRKRKRKKSSKSTSD